MFECELVSQPVASQGADRGVAQGMYFRTPAQQPGIPDARRVSGDVRSFAPRQESAADPHARQGQALAGACGRVDRRSGLLVGL